MSVTPNLTLDHKYTARSGLVLLSGIQALVRLPMLQRARDKAAGINSAGFISGYRGSPLGGLDKELWRAEKFLKQADTVFRPGLNEDLAAAAIWGSQQVTLFEGALVDGVFALWYGKGPGLDRSVDVFKHANSAGTARHGGVLVVAGDDHGCKSSTLAHQSEQVLMAAQMPVLNPANVQELVDYGLLGWALSRWSGLWVGLKAITETVESSGLVDVDPWRLAILTPGQRPDLAIRWPDRFLEQEMRLMGPKIEAALAFARANHLDRVVVDSPQPRFGIVTTGKAHLDVLQALDDLGIDLDYAARMGLKVYKVGMSWPLEADGIRAFAERLDEILVVEEKRPVIEDQLKAQLYNWREDVRPRVVGKQDQDGAPLLPSHGELTPAMIARIIAARIGRFYTSLGIRERLAWLDAKEAALQAVPQGFARVPYFCAGCPHNSSTNVPDGSRAAAGIGCHYMATWMPERRTETFTHMGGEGAPWIGQTPFTTTQHIFQNLGDGTYYHSGLLAIRACVAANVNITYKILYNDAVAMTGGQPVDGPLSVPAIAAQVRAEGVTRIAVVSDRSIAYADQLPPGTSTHHRDDMDALQRSLREHPGVSVLIYDQTCAAEKRRRRKRGLMDDPPERVFINQAVCEGCGDCGEVSNCVAVVPVETEFGRKRAIDQSACNKDFSCLKGFCPSFVTVTNATPKRAAAADWAGDLPSPTLPDSRQPFGIIVTGIGGTGVVTVAQVLGMAAHLDGKAVTALDQTGLAQKNGAVVSHVRLCDDPARLHAVRIADGGANLLLACDMVVAAGFDTLAKLKAGRTAAIINDHQTMPASFTHAPDLAYPAGSMHDAINNAVGGAGHFIDAGRIATRLLGDALATNLFLVGLAWQKGLIPLSEEAIDGAIALNGAMVEFNRAAFLWGRRAAHDRKQVEALADPHPAPALSQNLDELIAARMVHLTAWGDQAWAARYRTWVERARAAETDLAPGSTRLTEAVARSLAKLMSYKDEYEVARLYGGLDDQLKAQFESWDKVLPHLAPPWLGTRKYKFGPWMLTLFEGLKHLKSLRGTWLDPFGYSAERRLERALIDEYQRVLDDLLSNLTADKLDLATEIARQPLAMRGFGHVKAANVAKARTETERLMSVWKG
ncbi:indolepyruvate ferredoxin oxidoreductase family protein [Magnetospirillum moscoviense]|uniref:Indolepyruvate ferredoxin oxidoreductase n=1 Tax=Magnetospirillum moscoviense TaxID=1437059 RepID=A0A178MT72_9PROT|nr:indolepyruvate ferredoxin oxidoreductase family protein [Magnetospirillum moscoviense]OAN51464.1 indolepyruvate ferredoxin oxidoreductase [Magnetospirillum moscoviense]